MRTMERRESRCESQLGGTFGRRCASRAGGLGCEGGQLRARRLTDGSLEDIVGSGTFNKLGDLQIARRRSECECRRGSATWVRAEAEAAELGRAERETDLALGRHGGFLLGVGGLQRRSESQREVSRAT